MAARMKRPLPAAIQNAPSIEPGLHFYWQMFHDMNTERKDTDKPIPHSALRSLVKDLELDDDDADDVFYIIGQMDVAYLKFVEKKNKEQAKLRAQKGQQSQPAKPPPPKPTPRRGR